MALSAGVMSVTIEYAKDLKDKDWLGKQDPYCILRTGGQTFRSRTAKNGGRNPVWNETFKFNLINENDMEVEIKDEDIGRDDLIGTATFSLARARQTGSDHLQVPVVVEKKRKQRGFVSVTLSWAPNSTNNGGHPGVPVIAEMHPPYTSGPAGTGYPMSAAFQPAAPGFPRFSVSTAPPAPVAGYYPVVSTQYPPATAPFQAALQVEVPFYGMSVAPSPYH